jgi:hypothetical protein
MAIDSLLDDGKLAADKLTDFKAILYKFVNSQVDTGNLTGLNQKFDQWLAGSGVSMPKQEKIKKLRAAGWHANPNMGVGITATKETGRVVDVNDLEEAAEYGDQDDYYINVSVRSAKLALEILRDQFSNEYRQRIISLDGTNSYVINDREVAMELYDALKDADVEITATDVEVDDNDWDD